MCLIDESKVTKNWEMSWKLTLSWLEGQKVLLASIPADVGVTVIEVAVSFAAVLHAQLVSVSSATVNIINRYSMRHIGSIIDAFVVARVTCFQPGVTSFHQNTITKLEHV